MNVGIVDTILKFGQLGIILAMLYGLYRIASSFIEQVAKPVAQAWAGTTLKMTGILTTLLAQSAVSAELMAVLSHDHKEITKALRDLNGRDEE